MSRQTNDILNSGVCLYVFEGIRYQITRQYFKWLFSLY